MTVDLFRQLDVSLCGLVVDIVERDLARQVLAQCQVGHDVPGPVAAAAADIGDLDLFGHRSSLGVGCGSWMGSLYHDQPAAASVGALTGR
jgi:hypothetical protein